MHIIQYYALLFFLRHVLGDKDELIAAIRELYLDKVRGQYKHQPLCVTVRDREVSCNLQALALCNVQG